MQLHLGVVCGKGREKPVTTLTNQCDNFNKSIDTIVSCQSSKNILTESNSSYPHLWLREQPSIVGFNSSRVVILELSTSPAFP